MKPIGRFGGSGGAINWLTTKMSCRSRARVLRLKVSCDSSRLYVFVFRANDQWLAFNCLPDKQTASLNKYSRALTQRQDLPAPP